jgi:hypothetical protein
MFKVLLFGITIFIILSFVIILTFIAVQQDNGRITIKYDCSMLMGNWHPDVPKVVVEECKRKSKE